jgi:broad specificity phosphatase PhoE
MALLLMRHGPTELNSPSLEKDRIRGWKDVPLSHEGRQIADSLAQKAKAHPMHDLHSSDLSRASDTAHAVSKTTGLHVQMHHELRPWNLGKLTGQSTKKVLPLIKSLVKHPDMKAPGGESFSDFIRRFLPFIGPKLADKQLHGVVTHIRNIKTLEALIAGHGKLHQPTWDKVPSVDPGGMVYADEHKFEPLTKTDHGDQGMSS